MKLRLILLVIAVVVIAWIIWDHNRKNVKANKYIGKPSVKDSILNYFSTISLFKPKKNKKLNQNYQPIEQDDYADFDTEYEVASEFDAFDVLTREKAGNQFVEYPEYTEIKSKSDQVKKYNSTLQTPIKPPEMFLVSMHIKALNNKKIYGDTLLQALISVGCRFGEMSIFHRHEKTSGQGQILFSIASMVKPGIFDIDNMQSFSTPGITLFFSAPCEGFNPIMIYDVMLKTAYKLAKLLEAQILDDEREPLTNVKVAEIKKILEHYAQEMA